MSENGGNLDGQRRRFGCLINPYYEEACIYREGGTVATISGFEGKTSSEKLLNTA